jgi:hypothetical protein
VELKEQRFGALLVQFRRLKIDAVWACASCIWFHFNGIQGDKAAQLPFSLANGIHQ